VLRIRDVNPGSGFFPIPDPTKKEQGENKLIALPVFLFC
jgi:hypothetical protein